jgi:glycerol-3-phosphate cytidylyltransferase-like family protein
MNDDEKVTLRSQKEGLLNWINGQPDVEDKWRKEIIREIATLDRVLNEREMDIFLNRLASLKLGTGVTLEEAQIITDLYRKMEEAKQTENTEEYEKARRQLEEYRDSLMPPSDAGKRV